MLRANNLLYVVSKDKEKFANDESLEYRKVNGIYFDPLCINCNDNSTNYGGSSIVPLSQTKNTREDEEVKRAIADEEYMRKLGEIAGNWKDYKRKEKRILINIGPIEKTMAFLSRLKNETNLSNKLNKKDKKLLNKNFVHMDVYLKKYGSLKKIKLF
jgi:hypothetical protein